MAETSVDVAAVRHWLVKFNGWFPGASRADLEYVQTTMPALLNALDAANARAERAEEENTRLREALEGVQFDLLHCSQASGSDACEHLRDAKRILRAALADAPREDAPPAAPGWVEPAGDVVR